MYLRSNFEQGAEYVRKIFVPLHENKTLYIIYVYQQRPIFTEKFLHIASGV